MVTRFVRKAAALVVAVPVLMGIVPQAAASPDQARKGPRPIMWVK